MSDQKNTGFRMKIRSPDELRKVLNQLHLEGKKIVQCHGVFDLLHRGHLYQFEQAKAQGDVLIVSITTDKFVAKGPDRPVFSQDIRAEMVAAIELVDYVTLADTSTATELIQLFKPDVYVKGISCQEELENPNTGFLAEKKAVEGAGGVIFYSHEIPLHSTPLLNNFIDPYPENVLAYLKKVEGHYSFGEIAQLLDDLRPLKVLVIGEIIIDQYDFVENMDGSPKGGVLVARHSSTEMYAGGSIACANHISNFCESVTLLSCVGQNDDNEKYIRSSLNPNIQPIFFKREGFSVVVKRRELDKTYFQKRTETYLSFNDTPTPKNLEAEINSYLRKNLEFFDLVFVVDYGHGFITERMAAFLSDHGHPLAVNTQMNSANKGFHVITRYPRTDYACLDHAEARMALRDKLSSPAVLGNKLAETLRAQGVMVTLGHQGSVLITKEQEYVTPVFSKRVVDTVGAGDALFSVTALAFTKQWPPMLIGFIGNITGALATTYVGSKSCVTKNMLLNFIRSLIT